MNDLMTHVERIVRPVVAGEALKLRMRRELLAHLGAALEQERAAAPTEAEAVERSKRRLGEPDELRRQLQAAVPRVHRLLLAEVPLLGRLERWGSSRDRRRQASAPQDAFEVGPIAHFALLVVPTCFLPIGIAAPLVLAILGHAPAWPLAGWHPRLLIAVSALSVCLSTGPCMWFCKAIATAGKRVEPWRAAGSASAVVVLMTVWVWFLRAAVGGRGAPPLPYLACSLAGSVAILLVLAGATRWFSRLRQPYAEWTTLNLSDAAEPSG